MGAAAIFALLVGLISGLEGCSEAEVRAEG